MGADIDGVTENVKLLLRNTGDAAEPQRKMLAAQKAAAIAPTKQVRRLEHQVQDLEKQLGTSETARQLLVEEASMAKATCTQVRVPKLTVPFSHSSLHANRYRALGAAATQLRGALTACHDTVTKEQKRAAAAARGHAEERSRLQQVRISDCAHSKLHTNSKTGPSVTAGGHGPHEGPRRAASPAAAG